MMCPQGMRVPSGLWGKDCTWAGQEQEVQVHARDREQEPPRVSYGAAARASRQHTLPDGGTAGPLCSRLSLPVPSASSGAE